MTSNKIQIKNLFLSVALCAAMGLSVASCSDDDNTVVTYPVVIAPTYPQNFRHPTR